MSTPKVSVVIPVFDGLKFTTDLLIALKKTVDVSFEIIVCGTGTDGTVDTMNAWSSSSPNLKFIHNETEHTHFAVNCNMGAREAKGDYIVFLNNDTLVPAKWLKQLLFCMETINSSSFRTTPPPAVVAPCSNFVMSHQATPVPPEFDLSQLDEFAERVWVEGRGQWIYAAIVSGFCMLVKREIWESLGGFDETLVNGNEDVEFCCRVNEAGYACFVDKSTFVFHYGSKSIDASHDHGTYNRVEAVYKTCGAQVTEKKISGNIRLKCNQEQLEAWLQRHYDLFDIINIVDDNSSWDMLKYLRENWPNTVYVNMGGKLEVEQRIKLYELSFEQGMDWMVTLDHDELFEEKVDRAYLQRLANTPIPGVYCFVARWIHLWNSPNTYHIHYPPATGTFMTRVLPNLRFFQGTPGTSLHCGRMPNMPMVSTAPTNIRILHYGYLDPIVRELKRRFYETLDPEPIEVLVGGTDYSHLTAQDQIVISEWKGSDQYTLSLNAMTELEPLHKIQIFLEQHASIADEIIVRVSPDSQAKELLTRWGAKIYERKWSEDYSDMRNWLIEKSSCNYIWVMDIDEQYSSTPEIPMMLEAQPTAVMFNVNNIQKNRPDVFTEVMRIFLNRPEIRFNGLIHETVEDSMQALKKKVVIRAKGIINHFGFLTDNLQDKLKYYIKLNKRAMHKDPKDPKPYFNLALHYYEMGEIKLALDFLTKSIELYPKFTLSKIELAKLYLRFSRALFESSLSDIPEGHPLYQPMTEVTTWLRKMVPDKKLIFPPIGVDITPAKMEAMNERIRKPAKS